MLNRSVLKCSFAVALSSGGAGDWDSEDSGTEESGSEDDEEENKKEDNKKDEKEKLPEKS